MNDRCLGRFLCCVVLTIGIPVSVLGQGNKEFVLVREDDSIFVYERWIIFPGSDPPLDAREVKGEFTIKSTIYEALRLLKDEARIMRWQKHVTEFRVFPKPDTTTWIEYSYHDIPWPVSDQDHLLIYKIEEVEPQRLFITFESTVNTRLAPERDGVTRMNLVGSWTLEQTSTTQIKATYRIISQPSSIPRIFTDPVIRRNLMSTIKSFIEILETEEL